MTFHPRLPRLASGSDDCSIFVWDAEKASPVRHWQAYKIWVTGLTYGPDGSLLASACGNSSGYSFANDHSIHLWNADNGTLKTRLPRPPPMGVHALAFDPTGRRVVAGDDSGTVYLWDVDSGKTVAIRIWTLQPSGRWFSPAMVAMSLSVISEEPYPSSIWKGQQCSGESCYPTAVPVSPSTIAPSASSSAIRMEDYLYSLYPI